MDNEMVEIKALALHLFDSSTFEQWMDSPQKLMGGETPRALVDRGQAERVKRVLQAVIDGAHL